VRIEDTSTGWETDDDTMYRAAIRAELRANSVDFIEFSKRGPNGRRRWWLLWLDTAAHLKDQPDNRLAAQLLRERPGSLHGPALITGETDYKQPGWPIASLTDADVAGFGFAGAAVQS
jgi:hypothetical protein